MPSTVGGYISIIHGILLGLFNVGIITRMIKTYFDGMSEEAVNKKKIKNLIKATIVVNCIELFVALMRGYYFNEV